MYSLSLSLGHMLMVDDAGSKDAATATTKPAAAATATTPTNSPATTAFPTSPRKDPTPPTTKSPTATTSPTANATTNGSYARTTSGSRSNGNSITATGPIAPPTSSDEYDCSFASTTWSITYGSSFVACPTYEE
jgi:hypothetical protein